MERQQGVTGTNIFAQSLLISESWNSDKRAMQLTSLRCSLKLGIMHVTKKPTRLSFDASLSCDVCVIISEYTEHTGAA